MNLTTTAPALRSGRRSRRAPTRRPAAEGLHQDLWLPDERLRFATAWRTRWRRDGYAPTETIGGGRPRRSSTPATSARRRPRRSIPSSAACATCKQSARRAGRDMMIAVAGCVAQAEGEEIVRRAPAVDLVVGPQSLSPPARADRAAARGGADDRRDRLRRPRTSSSICRRRRAALAARRHRLPHRAGRLRQVLHLLRRALYARRGSVAPGRRRSSPRRERAGRRAACARSRCSARTSTPITAPGRTARAGGSARLLSASPRSPASRASATRPATRAT